MKFVDYARLDINTREHGIIQVNDTGVAGYWLKYSDKTGSALVFVPEPLQSGLKFIKKTVIGKNTLFYEMQTASGKVGLQRGNEAGECDLAYTYSTGGGGGHVIQNDGTPLPQRTNLNIIGAGATAEDDAGNNTTKITIPGGGGGGGLSDFFSASDSAGQTILATPDPTLLVFDDESYSNPNYSSSVFTVSAAGSYEFSSTIAIVSLSEDAVLQLFLVKNTAEVIKAEKFDLTGAIEGRSISLHLLNVQLALNDTIQMIAAWSGSQTISMIPAGGGGDNVFNWFEGRKI